MEQINWQPSSVSNTIRDLSKISGRNDLSLAMDIARSGGVYYYTFPGDLRSTQDRMGIGRGQSSGNSRGWYYGYRSSQDGIYFPGFLTNNAFSQNAFRTFGYTQWDNVSKAFKRTGDTYPYISENGFMIPGNVEHAVIAWQAPVDGTISVWGAAHDQDPRHGDSINFWAGLVKQPWGTVSTSNVKEYIVSPRVFGGSAVTWNTSLKVDRGQMLYFVAESRGDLYGDYCSLEISIRYGIIESKDYKGQSISLRECVEDCARYNVQAPHYRPGKTRSSSGLDPKFRKKFSDITYVPETPLMRYYYTSDTSNETKMVVNWDRYDSLMAVRTSLPGNAPISVGKVFNSYDVEIKPMAEDGGEHVQGIRMTDMVETFAYPNVIRYSYTNDTNYYASIGNAKLGLQLVNRDTSNWWRKYINRFNKTLGPTFKSAQALLINYSPPSIVSSGAITERNWTSVNSAGQILYTGLLGGAYATQFFADYTGPLTGSTHRITMYGTLRPHTVNYLMRSIYAYTWLNK